MNKHLIISGRVQGVGFRYAAKQKAEDYKLAGWVKNKDDGTVELEVEGTEIYVNSYISELKAGLNKFIRIENIISENSEEKGYSNFTIK
ncbi:acylphosphatase [Virgibacillus sp. C22-A2]|uniref:Acylphosphatase n=1 Tax=Virgibacillus tibetensis TaxID=3042313 RepID=A0ABU6KB23_9BACI|nr:acylphosphatase [Virgibacillus sp. C22-A2]